MPIKISIKLPYDQHMARIIGDIPALLTMSHNTGMLSTPVINARTIKLKRVSPKACSTDAPIIVKTKASG